MKRKKKLMHKDIFNVYENFINTEEKIKYHNNLINISSSDVNYNSININYLNLNDFIENNYNYLLNNMTLDKQILFNTCLKILFINKNSKYNFIRHFNSSFRLIEEFKNKINIYQTAFNNFVDDNINYAYLIGIVKDNKCVPFWNDKLNEISKKIFLPIKENLKKENSPNIFNYKSWFETTHYSNVNINEKLNKIRIKKERHFNITYEDKKTKETKNIIKCKKVKLYFNKEQQEYITKLFGAYRYYYNRAVQYINNYDKKTKKTFYYVDFNDKKSKKIVDLKDRKNVINFMTMRDYLKDDEPKFMNDIWVYSHLPDKAFAEACKNYDLSMTKFKKTGVPFTLKAKTKKDKFQTMNLEQSMYKQETNKLFADIKIVNANNKKISLFSNFKLSEDISKLNLCDFSITCNKRLNSYYMNVSYHDNSIRDKEILKNNMVCSIDAGLKTYLTLYCENAVEELGIGITKIMHKLCYEIDIINSRMNKKEGKNYKLKSNKRRNLKKALHRKIKKLENLKEELHNKCIKYLTTKFGRIILPKLEIQEMSSKFNSKLARSLYNLSNGKFLKKLSDKCKEYDIELITRPEYYTSKTCSRCGWLHHELKLSDRIYNCEKCKLKIDRDINASRNIMLRNNEWELPPINHL